LCFLENFGKTENNIISAAEAEKVLRYSSCTGRSSENICSSSGGAQEKGKTG